MAHLIGQPSTARVCAATEAQIRRFHSSVRRRLRRLAGDSPRVRDLLYTHPGAAFVLVAGNRAPDIRGEALRLAKAGRPLVEVDTALDLPRWLRRLPPEAFVKPLGVLPCGHEFGRRILHRIPAHTYATIAWLERMTVCAEACDAEMALWLANKNLCEGCCEDNSVLLPLGAFVWFSQRRDLFAYRLMEKPWHSKMRFTAAVEAAHAWFARIFLECCAESHRANGSWYKERKCHGYRFLPLRTAAELHEEGQRMRHCVATYAGRVAAGTCLIYSIRRGSTRVATLEIVPNENEAGNTGLAQLKGPGNATPDTDVHRAAEAWLAQRGRYPYAGAKGAVHEGRWREIWQPYCAAKPQAVPYLLGCQETVLTRLYSDLNVLARWHEV